MNNHTEEAGGDEKNTNYYMLRLHLFCVFSFLVQKRTQLKVRSSNRMWLEMKRRGKDKKLKWPVVGKATYRRLAARKLCIKGASPSTIATVRFNSSW